MWYNRTIIAAIDDAINALKAKGVREPIIQFIHSLPDNKKGKAIGALRQNPYMAFSDLEHLLQSGYRPSSQELQLVDKYDAKFKSWALYQYKLERLKKLTVNPEDDRWIYKIPLTGYAGIIHDLNQIHDFFRFIILDNPNYNIYSKSFQEAFDDSVEWLSDLESGKFYLPFERDKFENIADERIVHKFDDESMIVKVDNRNDLVTEGNLMHNCVGDHVREVEAGLFSVYSLRNKSNKPEVTFKVNPKGKVSEIKGPNNQPVTNDKQIEKIKEFVESRSDLEFE